MYMDKLILYPATNPNCCTLLYSASQSVCKSCKKQLVRYACGKQPRQAWYTCDFHRDWLLVPATRLYGSNWQLCSIWVSVTIDESNNNSWRIIKNKTCAIGASWLQSCVIFTLMFRTIEFNTIGDKLKRLLINWLVGWILFCGPLGSFMAM